MKGQVFKHPLAALVLAWAINRTKGAGRDLDRNWCEGEGADSAERRPAATLGKDRHQGNLWP
jgi:hypothetical protein